MKVKTYKGHSTEFTLKQEHIPFPEGHGNQSDQEVINELVKDLKGKMSVASTRKLMFWCLNYIKDRQENSPANVNWYEDTIEELKEKI